ncbi:hypothetical protein FN846DRAFT_929155 [Sphaerosporella brunnea]|uniref:BTB domain-containing protein n=1 Tax=Sphaerosporella brunnea TaxID=1250544 RepID=A0A5J5F9P1_9PEZI|nr:hypothetical protein FN846DRAFT_929155 [Sphaerosporella brunnea]
MSDLVFPESSSPVTALPSSDIAMLTRASLPEPCTDIVPDGDVILELSPTERFLVYSQVLCAASSIFNRMLSSGSRFSEAVELRSRASGDKPVVVKLEDDDSATLLIVLRVLHYQIKTVPQKLSVEQMVQVAIICDKYFLHESLQLMANTWIGSSWSEKQEQLEYWLLISWIFGPETIFTEVSRSLILEASEDTQKGFVIGPERRELPESVPAALIERLASSREKCMNAIRAEIDGLECKYLRDDWESNPQCSEKLKQCDALQLGLIYRSVLVSGAATWSGSVNAIVEVVQKCVVLEYENSPAPSSNLYCLNCGRQSNPPTGSGKKQHTSAKCSWVPKLKTKMEEILRDVEGLKFSEFPSRAWG